MAAQIWSLADAENKHAAAPRSFFIPPREHRERLTVGSTAKLLFEFPARSVDGVLRNGERMWVEVVEVQPDGSYSGRLANDPHVLTELSCGDPIQFSASNVIAIEYSVEELGYDPTAPAAIDARIVADDHPPTYVVRAQPPGANQELWFAGIDHEPPEERRMITLGALTDRWPELAVAFSSSGGYWERVPEQPSYRPATPPADS